MAIPTYATVISQIDTFIVTNGNNEITANVLNPILKVITDFANNTIGNLEDLTTDENSTVVSALNSLVQDIQDITSSGIQLHTGYDDPNDTPPSSYNYADFYMQLDELDDSPIKLWQWNGFEWLDYSEVPSTNSDNVQNNSSVAGSSVTDALNNLNILSGLSEQIEFTATGGETTHDIGTSALVKSWFWDGSPQAKSQWSQTGSVLTFAFPLSADSFNIFI